MCFTKKIRDLWDKKHETEEVELLIDLASVLTQKLGSGFKKMILQRSPEQGTSPAPLGFILNKPRSEQREGCFKKQFSSIIEHSIRNK